MTLKLISEKCSKNDQCPALYEDTDRYVVQGYVLDAAAEGLKLGEGEVVISVPKNILDSLKK